MPQHFEIYRDYSISLTVINVCERGTFGCTTNLSSPDNKHVMFMTSSEGFPSEAAAKAAGLDWARTWIDQHKAAMEFVRLKIDVDKKAELAVLQGAIDRCRTEDVQTSEVLSALDQLAAMTMIQWPFEQFRRGLKDRGFEGCEIEGCWQMLNAAMNGIRRVV